MSIGKKSGGLVPDPIDVGGLTEIRVHGVGGSRPEALLGTMSPTRVAGDRIAGFYRAADAAGRHREAYSWGGLTSHSPLRVLWMLLMPAMLANLAGWAARRRIMNGKIEGKEEPTTWKFRWCARGAALALTLSTAAMVTLVSLDTLAFQCLGQHPCRSQLWGAFLLDIIAPYARPGYRLAAGVIVPVLVAVGFYIMAFRSRASYEGVEPPTRAGKPIDGKESTPVPSSRCAAAQAGGLRSDKFWSGKRWHNHLSKLHLAAAFAVPAATLGWCVSALADAMNLPDGSAVVTARVASAASALLVILVIWMLKWDEAREGLASGVLAATVLVLIVAACAACALPLELVDVPLEAAGAASQPLGVLPGIEFSANMVWGLILVLMVPLMVQQTGAWSSRWRYAIKNVPRGPARGRIRLLREAARGSIQVFPWAAPVVLNVVALLLGNAVLLSLMVLVARFLGSVEYGFGPEESTVRSEVGARGGEGSVLWVPKAVGSIASILVLAFLAVLFLFLVIVSVWLAATSRKIAPQVRAELEGEYFRAPEAGTDSVPTNQNSVAASIAQRDAWIVSAFKTDSSGSTREPSGRPSDRGRPSRWVRKVARMRLIGGHAPTLVAWLMIAITAMGLSVTLWFLYQVWVLQQVPMICVELGTTVGVVLPVAYVLVARLAFRNEKWRRIVLSPFDVGTFFPRSFHPFAPPSYTERAVPELTRRIWWLHDNEGRVVLTAHSQGSVVAAAVVARESSRNEDGKCVGLVTFGCPLGKLYRWAFPALFSDGLLESIARGDVGFGKVKWRNLHYLTDYIGGPVGVEGGAWDAAKPDVALVDPATDKFIFGQPPPHILSHTGYWVDPRLWVEVDRMCEEIVPVASGSSVAARPVDLIAPTSLSPNGSNGQNSPDGSRHHIAPDPTIPERYRQST